MWPHCSVSCCCCCFACINHWQPVDGGETGQCGRHEISLTARHIAIPSHWLKFVGWLRQRLQLLLQFRRQMTKLSPLRTLNRRTMGEETATEAARGLGTAMWLRMEGKWRKQDMARLAAQLINFRISDSSLSGINDALASEWFINSCKKIRIPLPPGTKVEPTYNLPKHIPSFRARDAVAPCRLGEPCQLPSRCHRWFAELQSSRWWVYLECMYIQSDEYI